MYILNGTINYDGISLTNPTWQVGKCLDDIPNKEVNIEVIFTTTGAQYRRYMCLYYYSDTGTWEDSDLYLALLQLPELTNSNQI